MGQMKLNVRFYRSESGAEPVRRWLRSLSVEQKKAIGEDIKTVQFGWPLGMPLIEKLSPHLWEVRTKFSSGIARVIFTVDGDLMVLLHSFVKKAQKIPQKELHTAKTRLRIYQEVTS